MSNALTLVLSHGSVGTRQEVSTDLKPCKVQPTWFRQGQVILMYDLDSRRLPSPAPLGQIPPFLPFPEEAAWLCGREGGGRS